MPKTLADGEQGRVGAGQRQLLWKAQVRRFSVGVALLLLALVGAPSPARVQPHAQQGPDPEAARLAREQYEEAAEYFRVHSAAALKQSATDLAKARDIVCIRADRLDALIERLSQDAKVLGDLVSLSDFHGQ